MLTKTTQEIMIPLHKYPQVPKWFTIRQAIQLIQTTKIEYNGHVSMPRAILVIDEENKIVGMIQRRDILRSLEPKSFFVRSVDHPKIFGEITPNLDLIEIAYDHFFDRCFKQVEEPIWKYMSNIEYTVSYNDHLMKIIYLIDLTEMSIFPVVKEGEVIGVIGTFEVLNEIAKMLEIE